MINPKIVSFHSPDVDLYRGPPNPEEIYVLVEMDIGDEHGSDIYFAIIANIIALRRHTGGTFLNHRNVYLVDRWDWPRIADALTEIVEQCSGRDQLEVQLKLNRFFEWEYEDYPSGGRRS